MQTSALTTEALKWIEKGIQIGINKGMRIGYKKGFADGITHTLVKLMPAISDGLRHGSPVCASMMRLFRK